MNQAIRDRFYSQVNKKHVEYVIRTSGMNDQEEPIAELENIRCQKGRQKSKTYWYLRHFYRL